MINKLILTRKLYIYDDVKYTLITKLVHKDCEFIECIFWTCELFYSDFIDELCDILFETYYNFYAIKYPKYESKINIELDKKDIKSILYVVNLLFHTPNISTEVFKIYMKNPKSLKSIYITKHKNFSFLKLLDVDKEYYKFIASIHKNNFENIIFYIKNNTFKDTDKLYDSVIKYYSSIKNMKLLNKDINKIFYSNKQHIILSLICYLNKSENIINKRKIFRKFDISTYSDLINKFKVISGNNNYRILENNALYYISENIGCFDLSRFYFKNIKNEIRYHWDYHCYNSKKWKIRLDKYNFKINHNKKTLEFKNICEEEEFYEKYDYEFDEQTKELQDCIIPEIKKSNLVDWLKKIKN